MADGHGYKSFVEAHRRIVSRVQARKEGKPVTDMFKPLEHVLQPAYMFDCLTNHGKRYWKVQLCNNCDYFYLVSLTYDVPNDAFKMPYCEPPKANNGCVEKTVDN